jgi:hypothetical protein
MVFIINIINFLKKIFDKNNIDNSKAQKIEEIHKEIITLLTSNKQRRLIVSHV